MALAMPVVWSDRHRLHRPGGEIWVGVRTPGTEVPERAETIRETLLAAGAEPVAAAEHAEEALLRVHERALLAYLAGAWDGWLAAGLDDDPGQDRIVPYLFPHPGLLDGLEPAPPGSAAARAGLFAYDTMTLIGPGTRELGGGRGARPTRR
jgi:acetoin utilization deacetylase AcuC-like enzyme